MPQVAAREFERLPLRVHAFLAGVPLHDVWAIDLPCWRTGVTLDEFLRAVDSHSHHSCACCSTSASSLDTSVANNRLLTRSLLVRMLLGIRFSVGRFFGWDREPAATTWETFATHLTDTDHLRSLAAVGTRDGYFRVVYRFENEQLVELINRTAHAAALSALVETASGYRFYLGVYVSSVSRFTPLYMALIYPFRKLIVYPLLLRSVHASWNQAFGKG